MQAVLLGVCAALCMATEGGGYDGGQQPYSDYDGSYTVDGDQQPYSGGQDGGYASNSGGYDGSGSYSPYGKTKFLRVAFSDVPPRPSNTYANEPDDTLCVDAPAYEGGGKKYADATFCYGTPEPIDPCDVLLLGGEPNDEFAPQDDDFYPFGSSQCQVDRESNIQEFLDLVAVNFFVENKAEWLNDIAETLTSNSVYSVSTGVTVRQGSGSGKTNVGAYLFQLKEQFDPQGFWVESYYRDDIKWDYNRKVATFSLTLYFISKIQGAPTPQPIPFVFKAVIEFPNACSMYNTEDENKVARQNYILDDDPAVQKDFVDATSNQYTKMFAIMFICHVATGQMADDQFDINSTCHDSNIQYGGNEALCVQQLMKRPLRCGSFGTPYIGDDVGCRNSLVYNALKNPDDFCEDLGLDSPKCPSPSRVKLGDINRPCSCLAHLLEIESFNSKQNCWSNQGSTIPKEKEIGVEECCENAEVLDTYYFNTCTEDGYTVDMYDNNVCYPPALKSAEVKFDECFDLYGEWLFIAEPPDWPCPGPPFTNGLIPTTHIFKTYYGTFVFEQWSSVRPTIVEPTITGPISNPHDLNTVNGAPIPSKDDPNFLPGLGTGAFQGVEGRGQVVGLGTAISERNPLLSAEVLIVATFQASYKTQAPKYCYGLCGQKVTYGCYCDPTCTKYGDCCDDACDSCGYCYSDYMADDFIFEERPTENSDYHLKTYALVAGTLLGVAIFAIFIFKRSRRSKYQRLPSSNINGYPSQPKLKHYEF